MGSWAELDAYYPPGALTPATVFIVALCRLAGATSVYADKPGGQLAAWLPRRGLGYDRDLLERVEESLERDTLDEFLERARALLNAEQKRCAALNLLDFALAEGWRPEASERFVTLIEGLGMDMAQLQPYREALALKNELALFPQ